MIDKIKKTPENIKIKILDQLRNGPKTNAEIGEAINSNWLTIEKFLKELKEEGLVIEVVSSPKMKVYKRTDDPAFYGLPFSEEIRNKSSSLLFTIADKWKKEKGIIPARTTLQKVAVELIESSDGKLSDIPILRFHYGQTLAVGYEDSRAFKYTILPLTQNQIEVLSRLINEYHGKPSKHAKSKQYQKKGMEFYKEKEENLLGGFSETDYKKVESSLLRLSILYPIELKNTFPIFYKFVYCAICLSNLKETDFKKDYFNKIKENFYLLWDAITTEYFFYDAERYIIPEKKEMFNQIRSMVLNSKLFNVLSIIEDLESEVNSINPEEIETLIDKESIEIRRIFTEGAEEE
ncbi:MAG: winged helix-turn-helix domain-containing protein [Nanoarchaeota archaeon]|nr:winged helix-turn-helix domain-containing protein [Nanoarchaeota archaeon]